LNTAVKILMTSTDLRGEEFIPYRSGSDTVALTDCLNPTETTVSVGWAYLLYEVIQMPHILIFFRLHGNMSLHTFNISNTCHGLD